MTSKITDPIIKEIIELSYAYLNIRDENTSRPITTGDLYFILPSLKKAISLYDAIQEDIKSNRLISGTILSRTLIEVIVTLLYVTNLEKDETFYDKFIEHGRLRRKRQGKGWEKITISEQIAWVEENYKITRLQEVYDNCSKLVHFSSSSVQLILDRRDGFEKDNVKIVISPDEAYFSDDNFSEMRRSCTGMIMILRAHLKAIIDGKHLQVERLKGVVPE